jgi:hypothetical protein
MLVLNGELEGVGVWQGRGILRRADATSPRRNLLQGSPPALVSHPDDISRSPSLIPLSQQSLFLAATNTRFLIKRKLHLCGRHQANRLRHNSPCPHASYLVTEIFKFGCQQCLSLFPWNSELSRTDHPAPGACPARPAASQGARAGQGRHRAALPVSQRRLKECRLSLKTWQGY